MHFKKRTLPLGENSYKHNYFLDGKQSIGNFDTQICIHFHDWENRTCTRKLLLREFIGVETTALTFRTKQYSTIYSSHICYGKRFYNDFFLYHITIALVRNCLKLLGCVVIETALDGMKKNQLS